VLLPDRNAEDRIAGLGGGIRRPDHARRVGM